MKCKHCGNENPDDSIFCELCGKKIIDDNQKKRLLYVLLTVVLIGVSAAVVFGMFGKDNDNDITTAVKPIAVDSTIMYNNEKDLKVKVEEKKLQKTKNQMEDTRRDKSVKSQQAEEYETVPLEEVEEEAEEEIFTVVENEPEFPGGMDALYKYLAINIKYPARAKENNITGTVYVTFVVEKDGSIVNPRILRDIGGDCGQEVIRVVKSMPKWKPGKQRNKNVRVQYNLPVHFNLQ